MTSNSQHTLRKAIEALKDSTKIGLAKVNGDNNALDVAIVKATSHKEVIPKDKHVRTILIALSASSPRSIVAFCIRALFKRLAKTRNWTVALKTLIIVHRAMREVGTSLQEQLIHLGRGRGFMLNLAQFRDESSPQAWDYSSWIRTYVLYLEERLECFHALKYDVNKDQSRNRKLDTPNLLKQLPALQLLLHRLLDCKPEGAALSNLLIHYVLSMIAGESVKLYIAITDGILNLVDKYFEMQLQHAVEALEIYQNAGNQASDLSEFFEICRGLHYGEGQRYLKIKPLPASFLIAMEDYVKEAPEVLALPFTEIRDDQVDPNTGSLIDHDQDTNVDEKSRPSTSNKSQSDPRHSVGKIEIGDLLCFDDPPEEESEQNENNSLALAIIESENPSNDVNDVSSASGTTGWEFEVFGGPSSNEIAVAENKLTGGMDRLTLDSLYDQAIVRRTNPGGASGQMSTNPFDVGYNLDPFYGSGNATIQAYSQMTAFHLQQTHFMQQLPQQHYIMQQQQQQQQPQPFHTDQNQDPLDGSCNVKLAADLQMVASYNMLQQQQPHSFQIDHGSSNVKESEPALQMVALPHQQIYNMQQPLMVANNSTISSGNPFC